MQKVKPLITPLSVIIVSSILLSFTKKSTSNNAYYIIIDKSDYELFICKDGDWIIAYPVVFGTNDLSDKQMQGDKRTPEGTFKIKQKRIHNKWNKIFMLDYPTKESYIKFITRKENGMIPNNAKIGGDIAIHGCWPNEDFVVDQYLNWTLGCISMKNEDVDAIYPYISVGTKVIIRP